MDGASFSGLSRLLRGLLRPKQWREHKLLQGLLVQAGERRNPRTLESVGISARAMQRFLTEARWDDAAVIGRLQEYLAPRPRGGVGVGRQRLSQAGTEVGGGSPAVLRQAGEGGQLPGGDVPGLRQPAGTGIGGRRAVSARELDLRPGPVCGGGCARGAAELPVEDGVGLGAAGAGPGVGPPQGRMGCRGTPSGCRRPFGSPWRAWGCATCWTFRAALLELAWTSPGSQGSGRPRKPRLRDGQRRTMERAVASCRIRLGGR